MIAQISVESPPELKERSARPETKNAHSLPSFAHFSNTCYSQDSTDFKIAASPSHDFLNKINVDGSPAAFSTSFHAAALTPRQLYDHATQGYAFALGVFRDNYRKTENFISAQLLALDFDEGNAPLETLAAHPFIRQYASFIYESPSSTPEHPKSRAVFVLSEPVTDAQRFEAMLRGLIDHFADLQPDKNCSDCARFFYGSDKRSQWLGNILPIEIAGNLTLPEAEADYLQSTRTDAPAQIPLTGNRAGRYVAKAIEDELAAVRSAVEGTRNPTLFKAACALFGLAKGGYGSHAELEHALTSAAQSTGLPAHEITATLRSAEKTAEPRSVNIPATGNKPERKPLAQRVTAVDTGSLTGDCSVDLPDMTAIDMATFAGWRAALVRSAIGTGKTELGKKIIERAERRLNRPPTVLVVTHRRALVEQTAARYDIMSYKDLPDSERYLLRSAPQLAITLDSLYKVAGNAYDLVIVDEVTQVIDHLEGGTLKRGEAKRAYAALKNAVRSAGQFFAFDAGLDDITQQWTRQLCGEDTLFVVNTHKAERGAITLHVKRETVYAAALATAEQNSGCVVIATNGKEESEIAFKLFSERFGKENGFLINSDNSESRDAQRFVAQINTRIKDLRFFVYSPSLGTGVSITTPVAGVFGVFYNHTTPADDLQMMGRCRAAGERHAYIRPDEGHREIDPDVLYKRYTRNADVTAGLCGFSDHNIPTTDADLTGATKLLAMRRAKNNRMRNDPLSWFVSLAKGEGYSIAYHEGENKALRALLKAAREAAAAERKARVLAAEAITHDQLDAHRRNGTLTPEIRAGNERYKIEDCAGLTISPQVYDDLRKPDQRAALIRLTNMLDDLDTVKAEDRSEALDGELPSRRRHRTAVRLFFEALLRALGCSTLADLPSAMTSGVWKENGLSAEEIDIRLSDFFTLHTPQLCDLFGYRPGHHASEPAAVLRWILRKIGLKIASKQILRTEVSDFAFRVYSVDADVWTRFMDTYAPARLAHQRRIREKMSTPQKGIEEGKPILKSGQTAAKIEAMSRRIDLLERVLGDGNRRQPQP